MDIRTFKNLQDDVLNWLDEAGDTDTTLTLAKQAINTAHKKRVTQEKWPFMLWNKPQTFTTVSGQQSYALHQEFSRPSYFWNRNLVEPLTQYDNDQLLVSGLDWNNDTDSARRFLMRSPTMVQNQPTSASVLAVSSSSGSDTAATVTVTGETTSGIESETITAGTSSSKQFSYITKIRKDGVWVGTMTITSNAAAVTVLSLLPAEFGRSYPQLFLTAQPPAGEVVEYMFYRAASRLVDDNDIPDIPGEFAELTVWDTLLDFAAYNQYDAGVVSLWARRQQETLQLLQQTTDAKASGFQPDYINYIPR